MKRTRIYRQGQRLYRWPRRQMMIATNISKRPSNPDGTILARGERSISFSEEASNETPFALNVEQDGDTLVERGTMQSFPFPPPVPGTKRSIRVLPQREKPRCACHVAGFCSKAKFRPRWSYREETSRHKTVNYL